ncbi:MAG: hypothetical protein KOO62_11965 [candidate division Zixibacteria bacterium]|nr:hypothetical protein [candidate division Zixibacteria bacterium]
MMIYFEVRERMAGLKEFRDLYREYLDFTNRENNIPAQIVRQKMEPMTIQVCDSLRRVKLGRLITRNAPAKGGKRVRINLIKAIFRDQLRRDYSLGDQAALDILDRGIIRYKTLLWRQTLVLYNPLFWLYHGAGFIAELPLLIFRRAGYSVEHAEKLTSVRLLKILIQVLVLVLVAKWVGVVDWIRIDILAL